MTPLNAEYWGCLLTLADHELEAQRCEPAATCCCRRHPPKCPPKHPFGVVSGVAEGLGVWGQPRVGRQSLSRAALHILWMECTLSLPYKGSEVEFVRGRECEIMA